jgi:tRNA(Ile)-lysidine synthase
MEEACRRLCKDFQIKIIVGKCDIKANNNVEDILRKERHKFFAEVGGAIVAAHHLNDCVENYISNALKGCPENKPIPEFTDFGNFQVYRPFLRNPKKNLENWIDKKQLHAYIERDESNNDNKYRRNWLRNVIIPAIEERSKLEKVVLKKFYL